MAWYDKCKFPDECGDQLKRIAQGNLRIRKVIASTFRHIPGEDYSGTYIKFEDENGNIHGVITPIDVEDRINKHHYIKNNLPKILCDLMNMDS